MDVIAWVGGLVPVCSLLGGILMYVNASSKTLTALETTQKQMVEQIDKLSTLHERVAVLETHMETSRVSKPSKRPRR